MIKTESIFNISTSAEFNALALEVFKYQFDNNAVYRSFCDLLHKHPSEVKTLNDIPFLPIQFFKSHDIISSKDNVVKTFTSSGTTGTMPSKHFITDLGLYEQSFNYGFKQFYGNIEDYTVLALLPAYLEREGSSLIYMIDHLIKQSKQAKSGFYLNNLSELYKTLSQLDSEGKKALLIGVSFALLDLVETYQFNLKNTIVMETGGMKGRRKEITRKELHNILKKGFGIDSIHSEYGMTELLTQAYSKDQGLFYAPKWMRVITREAEDPISILPPEKTGGINVIDLANINSCSFIATQDLGKYYQDGSFEVLGRFDNSDIRGCNLMLL